MLLSEPFLAAKKINPSILGFSCFGLNLQLKGISSSPVALIIAFSYDPKTRTIAQNEWALPDFESLLNSRAPGKRPSSLKKLTSFETMSSSESFSFLLFSLNPANLCASLIEPNASEYAPANLHSFFLAALFISSALGVFPRRSPNS